VSLFILVGTVLVGTVPFSLLLFLGVLHLDFVFLPGVVEVPQEHVGGHSLG
jgi:hypothetical protein